MGSISNLVCSNRISPVRIYQHSRAHSYRIFTLATEPGALKLSGSTLPSLLFHAISMSSSKKKRSKPGVGDSSPSSSSFPILREPPPNLFPSKAESLKLLAVLAIAASVAFACNRTVLFFSRQTDPFCDTGEAPISGLCEPCPDNAHCSNGQLVCSNGYKKIGRKCIEDGEINLTAKKLSEQVEHHVCDAYAQILCDEAGKIWFEEPDIMMLLQHEARSSIVLKDGTFSFAKQKIMETLDNSLEKRAVINGSNQYKCPDMRAELHKPLLCCIRQWLYGNALLVATLSTVLLGIIRFLWSLQRKKSLSSRAEQLYEQVCEILEDHAMTAKSMNKGEPWVVASWLRDHLLLPRERRDPKLWKKVEELLREDSRIDQYPKLVKGESKIVLEWQVDGSLSSKMRVKRAISKTKTGNHICTSSSYQQGEAAATEPSS